MGRTPEQQARIDRATTAAKWVRDQANLISHFASRAAFGERASLRDIEKAARQVADYARDELRNLPRDAA